MHAYMYHLRMYTIHVKRWWMPPCFSTLSYIVYNCFLDITQFNVSCSTYIPFYSFKI